MSNEENLLGIFVSTCIIMRDEKIITQRDLYELRNILQDKIRKNRSKGKEQQSFLQEKKEVTNSYAGVNIQRGGN